MEYSARLELVKTHRLYVWPENHIKALNYFRHNKPFVQNLQWEPCSKITMVQKRYPDITAHAAAIINKYKLNKDYHMVQLLYQDLVIQIWLADAQLEPICNITDWAK